MNSSLRVRKEGKTKFDIIAVFNIGVYRSSQRYPQHIIVKFSSKNAKAIVLKAAWENSNLLLEGDRISIYLDLSHITEKKADLDFLQQPKIVEYRSKT